MAKKRRQRATGRRFVRVLTMLSEQTAWLGANAQRDIRVDIHYSARQDTFVAEVRSKPPPGGDSETLLAFSAPAATIEEAIDELAEKLAEADPDELLVHITQRGVDLGRHAQPWERR